MFEISYDDDLPIVFIDGCTIDSGKPEAKAGVGVYFHDNNRFNISAPVEGSIVSSEVAELQAAIRGIEQANRIGIHRLVVATDSQYVIDMATNVIPQYKSNNWKTRNNEPPANLATLKKLDDAINSMMIIKWKLVKKAENNPAHLTAYRMAYNGAKMYDLKKPQ